MSDMVYPVVLGKSEVSITEEISNHVTVIKIDGETKGPFFSELLTSNYINHYNRLGASQFLSILAIRIYEYTQCSLIYQSNPSYYSNNNLISPQNLEIFRHLSSVATFVQQSNEKKGVHTLSFSKINLFPTLTFSQKGIKEFQESTKKEKQVEFSSNYFEFSHLSKEEPSHVKNLFFYPPYKILVASYSDASLKFFVVLFDDEVENFPSSNLIASFNSLKEDNNKRFLFKRSISNSSFSTSLKKTKKKSSLLKSKFQIGQKRVKEEKMQNQTEKISFSNLDNFKSINSPFSPVLKLIKHVPSVHISPPKIFSLSSSNYHSVFASCHGDKVKLWNPFDGKTILTLSFLSFFYEKDEKLVLKEFKNESSLESTDPLFHSDSLIFVDQSNSTEETFLNRNSNELEKEEITHLKENVLSFQSEDEDSHNLKNESPTKDPQQIEEKIEFSVEHENNLKEEKILTSDSSQNQQENQQENTNQESVNSTNIVDHSESQNTPTQSKEEDEQIQNTSHMTIEEKQIEETTENQENIQKEENNSNEAKTQLKKPRINVIQSFREELKKKGLGEKEEEEKNQTKGEGDEKGKKNDLLPQKNSKDVMRSYFPYRYINPKEKVSLSSPKKLLPIKKKHSNSAEVEENSSEENTFQVKKEDLQIRFSDVLNLSMYNIKTLISIDSDLHLCCFYDQLFLWNTKGEILKVMQLVFSENETQNEVQPISKEKKQFAKKHSLIYFENYDRLVVSCNKSYLPLFFEKCKKTRQFEMIESSFLFNPLLHSNVTHLQKIDDHSFVCSHQNGSLVYWKIKEALPVSILHHCSFTFEKRISFEYQQKKEVVDSPQSAQKKVTSPGIFRKSSLPEAIPKDLSQSDEDLSFSNKKVVSINDKPIEQKCEVSKISLCLLFTLEVPAPYSERLLEQERSEMLKLKVDSFDLESPKENEIVRKKCLLSAVGTHFLLSFDLDQIVYRGSCDFGINKHKKSFVFQNAHKAKIVSIFFYSKNCFITSSKDSTYKTWKINFNSSKKKNLFYIEIVPLSTIDIHNNSPITSLVRVHPENYISCDQNGNLLYWRTNKYKNINNEDSSDQKQKK